MPRPTGMDDRDVQQAVPDVGVRAAAHAAAEDARVADGDQDGVQLARDAVDLDAVAQRPKARQLDEHRVGVRGRAER